MLAQHGNGLIEHTEHTEARWPKTGKQGRGVTYLDAMFGVSQILARLHHQRQIQSN